LEVQAVEAVMTVDELTPTMSDASCPLKLALKL
jgi:hypothetical protein